jgi:hypothetical protein
MADGPDGRVSTSASPVVTGAGEFLQKLGKLFGDRLFEPIKRAQALA